MTFLTRYLIGPLASGVLVALLLAATGWGIARSIEVGHLERMVEKLQTALGIANSALEKERRERLDERLQAERTARTESELNRSKERNWKQNVGKLSDELQLSVEKVRERDRTISRLRADRVRLSAEIQSYASASRRASSGTPGAPQCPDDPRTGILGGLLAEGVQLAGEGADVVDDLTRQVTGLHRYVNEVCLAK